MKDIEKAKKIVSTDGLDIYYWMNYIKGSKEPIVVLHPASSMNHSSLEPLERELNHRQYSTLILEPRGVGYSVAPASKKFYKLERYTDDLCTILRKEGIENPILVGHSAGFMPSVDYAAKSENATQIVGVAGSYHFPDTTKSKIGFHLFNRFIRYNELIGSIITGLFLHTSVDQPRIYNDQSNWKESKGMKQYALIADVSLHEAYCHIVSGIEINKWDIRPQLQSLHVPLMLIQGQNDIAVVPDTAPYIKRLVSTNCETYTFDSGHDIAMQKPEYIAALINQIR
jgi:pimeloyl-ACP methyl ester carboxylesterase